MSSLTQEQKEECERLFKFLDKDQDNQLTGRELIIGLGVLGKVCTMAEQKNLINVHKECDLDTFLNICAEKVNFKNVDIEQVKSFKVLESPEKPGYISKKDFIFILKKFNENITDKDINDIIKEVGSNAEGYINLENLAKEMLVK